MDENPRINESKYKRTRSSPQYKESHVGKRRADMEDTSEQGYSDPRKNCPSEEEANQLN